MKLFVEGGGDYKELRIECRQAFNSWLRSAGLQTFPKIVACGGRNQAFNDFKRALANGEAAMLLVDSEAAVAAKHQIGNPEDWLPWDHLKGRDGWARPVGSTDIDCHLMVQCMENWFLCETAKLSGYFGQNFKTNKLPAVPHSIEAISKTAILDGLKVASAKCEPKGPYSKGPHSFKILKLLDAKLIVGNAPWAKRFADEMKKRFP